MIGGYGVQNLHELFGEERYSIPMIIEHLEESDVPRAKKFLDGKLRANGL